MWAEARPYKTIIPLDDDLKQQTRACLNKHDLFFDIKKIRKNFSPFHRNTLTRHDESEASHPSLCFFFALSSAKRKCTPAYQVICIAHSIRGSALHCCQGQMRRKEKRSTKERPFVRPACREIFETFLFSLVRVGSVCEEKRCSGVCTAGPGKGNEPAVSGYCLSQSRESRRAWHRSIDDILFPRLAHDSPLFKPLRR